MSKLLFVPLQLSLGTALCLSASPLLAQVTPDGTVNTQVNQNGSVAEITGGEARGSNLFHSFQEFSIPTNNEAFFNNADSIANIFSRVTGGNISNIDGLIRANDTNLFLINPAGILFGENARLDIGGSFYGSTADSILFEDGEFSANLDNPPLLTINAPIGLNFRDEPGEIVNRANFGLSEQALEQEIDGELATVNRITNITGLEVNPGQNLALIGGDITLVGSGITASGGKVTLGGLSQAGTVAISPDRIFSFPENVAKADLSLESNALVSVIGNGGGAINVDVSNLTLSQQSQLRSGIAEGAGNSNTVAGDIVINASDSVTLIGNGEFEDGDRRLDLNTGIFNAVGLSPARIENFNNADVDNTAGSSGSIAIATEELNISERGAISTLLYGVGNAGDININADTVTLNEANLTSQVGLFGIKKSRGNSGGININSNNFSATNLTFVVTDNFGTGEGNTGDINITATDSLEIQDDIFTAFISETGEEAVANAGDINIATGSVSIEDSVLLVTQVRGRGNTGSINLDIADSLVISGFADIQAQVLSGGEGTSGNIEINASTFELLEDSQLLADNRGSGNSGAIVVQADESILIDDSIISTGTIEDTQGSSGRIEIVSPQISLDNRAIIVSSAEGKGDTGDIDINAETVSLDNLSLITVSGTSENSQGSGSITVNADRLTLTRGSIISAETRGSGNAGDLNIDLDDSLNIDGSNSGVFSGTGGTGNAGTIEIAASQIEIENNGQVGVNNLVETEFRDEIDDGVIGLVEVFNPVEGSGDAGTLEITADTILLQDGGSLTAISAGGNGGNIVINSNLLELRDEGNISATAGVQDTSGNGGNINIDSDFIVAFPEGDNDITANAFEGKGGNVTIATEGIFGIEERLQDNPLTNDITASSDVGVPGDIILETLVLDPVQGASQLPTNIVVPEETAQQACQANREIAAQNSFSIEGQGGIIPEPGLPLNSNNIYVGGETNSTSTIPAPIETAQGKIQPARGIKVAEDGTIILTAYRTDNAGERIPPERNCG